MAMAAPVGLSAEGEASTPGHQRAAVIDPGQLVGDADLFELPIQPLHLGQGRPQLLVAPALRLDLLLGQLGTVEHLQSAYLLGLFFGIELPEQPDIFACVEQGL